MDNTNRKNRAWRLSNRPQGKIKSTDLELVETPIPEPGPNEVLARTIYFSLDPTNRIWMSDIEQYMEPVKIGDVMRAGGSIAVVEVSNADDIDVGDIIQGGIYGGWQEYFLIPGEKVIKIPVNMGLPLPAFLSVLGFTGPTAYFGLLDVGKPKYGETVVVSAAAGAVGSIVCQIAKIKGCHVVGIAGSDEKCDWLTHDLGVDSAINYKSEDVLATLKKYCSNGIDIYFDNVGGEILDAALTLMNKFGRIPVCGLISMYNNWSVPGPRMFRNVLMKTLTVQGFLILDYLHRIEESLQTLSQWIAEGKIQYKVDIVDGIENAPTALNKLFTGENKGKLLIKTSEVES
ncbi:MAG: NADP-dependent oxidoreductase [Okeania sp. SIO2D1]|nr:NADP-dependent oxidoreductase [Okeania sp. SIO2D1]